MNKNTIKYITNAIKYIKKYKKIQKCTNKSKNCTHTHTGGRVRKVRRAGGCVCVCVQFFDFFVHFCIFLYFFIFFIVFDIYFHLYIFFLGPRGPFLYKKYNFFIKNDKK